MNKKKNSSKLLVKRVSQNRGWMGDSWKNSFLSSRDKVGSQERRGGSVNFGKKGKVFSKGGERVENSFL